jgi:plastocyanin
LDARFQSTGRKLATVAAAAAIAASALVLAACGGSDDTSVTAAATTSSTESSTTAPAGGATVKFEADPGGALAFTATDVTAKAGDDTIEFDNPSSTPHNVVVENESGDQVASTDTISDSTTSTTADLKPGTYTFYCSIPGHREAGMEGTLTVK